MLTQRIQLLRKQSLEARACLSPERALLVTEFYKNNITDEMSVPVIRAKCFEYILKNKQLCINNGELIVGERGPALKAVPTYPEVSLHSPEDLEILNSREKVSYKVDEDTKRVYRETIIPFWTGKSQRERLMKGMSQEWLEAYKTGIFTEFQEQRAPGHTVLGDKIYKKGMLQIINDIQQQIEVVKQQNLSFSGLYSDRLEELRAMEIAANALIMYAGRHADLLEVMAEKETDAVRKAELVQMAEICRRVPANAPQTLHEALQYYWFVHVGVITESNPWDSFNPGRLDQHLLPFYRRDLAEGRITGEKARELLQAFWIKFNNHPAPPKVGVTALESNTYTDFCLINLGGVKADGSDAVNEMTYLLLDVIEEMRLLQPGSMIQVSKKNPDAFVRRALKIIRTGFGQPSVFNTDAIIQELLRQGKDIMDARKGGASGCVETGAFGTECYILTGYFNLARILEITLNNGIDPLTGKGVGIQTGNPVDFQSFDEVLFALEKQIRYFADIKIEGNRYIEELFVTHLPVPFLSLLIDDCIEKGMDYNAGGARYNTSYIQGVGLGSLTDSLTAIKYHVFDNKNITMNDFLSALRDNFESWPEFRHQLLYLTPKYGNDDDYADEQACSVFEMFYAAIDGRPTYRDGYFRVNLLPTTCHVYFGSVTGALPDGRQAFQPLSEGISPVQGADHRGPTAVIRSAARIDHIRTGGTLLNQKFSPSFFDGNESLEKLTALIRGYFKLDGHHIQFNVVSADTLKDAQEHPEKYRDLIVRVAGYSDYFNDLGRDLQDEIIRRTENG
ncbi:MAG: glycyl radical protein [Bacteroidetes bacterium]|nr:glycyl radical protein [Bacteroidota bacterium]